MSLLKQIHDWSVGLKPCLRDALRRLLQNPSLTDSDFDDLFALLKLDAGIPDSKNRKAEPLDVSHLPSMTSQGKPIRLLSLHSLKNVNRIAENQTLQFVPLGLTVIYGDNGTGKSGYSRVLKLACRARDEKATVLPNAHLPKGKQGVPEAHFVIEAEGQVKKLAWKLGDASHPEMSALSVFDSHCARAYLDAEQDVAYLPYGIDLVENLAQVVLPELTKRLTSSLQACVVEPSTFQDLLGNTAVGKMVANLSAATDKTDVTALSTIEEKDNTRHHVLTVTLKEQDPKAKAAALRRMSERLKAVQTKMDMAFNLLNGGASDRLKTLDVATQAAIAAESVAATHFQSGESLLPGAGGPEWQALFESARAFAALAYKDNSFPVSDEDARCLLCQQELSDGAGRLKRFDDFVKNDTATIAKMKRAECAQAISQLEKATVSFGLDTSLITELDQNTAGFSDALIAYQTKLEERRKWLIDSLGKHTWANEPGIETDPRSDLAKLISGLGDMAVAHGCDRTSGGLSRDCVVWVKEFLEVFPSV
jgi:hypothetical protein